MSGQDTVPREGSRNIPHWYGDDEPLEIERADGATVYDPDGEPYLDFLSQLYCVNAGHGNEAIVDAIKGQAEQVQYVSSSKHNTARTEFADRLVDVAPDRLTDVFFSISGSEANESAAQLARAYKGGGKVLTRWRSYHGSTYGAAGLTGDPETRATLERHASVTGTGKFLPPIPRAFGTDDPDELAARAADHLEFVIRNEDPDNVAAVLTEPVAGTSGAYTAPPGYFERVREICDEYDVLLVSDEVIAGFGRCGAWFGMDTEGVEPDMITFAKGATSAYVPLAGVLTRGDVAEFVREEGYDLGQTFAGHPIACAAGVAAIDEYEDGLIDNVRDLEPVFAERLDDIEARHDAVDAVHGRGFHWGVEYADPETGEHFFDPRVEEGDNPAGEVLEEASDRGVLFGSFRPNVGTIVSPPLCATEAEIHEALDVLDEAIDAVF
jgi:taurine--2-oxoglutarate transaminase